MYSKLIYSYVYIYWYIGSWSRSSICVQCDEKRCYLQVFAKSQCCTGYPLIQVQIESVCKKSLFVLAGLPKLSVDFLAVLGVWSLMDYLQCGCRCRCRYRSFCCRCRCRSFCCFCCLCIFHVFFLSFCKIQN